MLKTSHRDLAEPSDKLFHKLCIPATTHHNTSVSTKTTKLLDIENMHKSQFHVSNKHLPDFTLQKCWSNAAQLLPLLSPKAHLKTLLLSLSRDSRILPSLSPFSKEAVKDLALPIHLLPLQGTMPPILSLTNALQCPILNLLQVSSWRDFYLKNAEIPIATV